VEELFQASFGGLASLDFPLPPSLVGVGDELVLAVEPGSESGAYSQVVTNCGIGLRELAKSSRSPGQSQ
jgi:hypothetical protein